MNADVKLLSVSTAVPEHIFLQEEVVEVATSAFSSRYRDFDRLARVFETTGVRKRHAVRPLSWFLEPRGWPERTAAYLDGTCHLFVEAANQALNAGGLTARDVDTVVMVSSTGIATPSIEARVAHEMGFRVDVERVPIFGLGCAGGVSGVSIAARLAAARPKTVVLLVTVELCSLAFRLDELTKANIIATALFGDGGRRLRFAGGSERHR